MPARTRKRARLPEPETEEPPVTLNTVVEAHFMDIGTVTDAPTNLKVLSHDFEVQTIPGEYQTRGRLYYSLIGNHLQNWDLTDINAFVGSKADKVMVDAVPRPSTPTPSRGLIKTCAKCDEEQKWAIQVVKHHESHCKIAINQDLEELISPKPKVYRGLGHLPLPAEPEIIFSHGKTRGIDDPGFIHFVEGMARFFNILCFQGNASQNDRLLSYRYFLDDAVRTCKAMGGRSVGSLSAVRASIYTTNKKFILWSFPLVQDMENMEEVLLALPADAKVLFIRGSKDFMSPDAVFTPLRARMKAESWCIRVLKADHSMQFGKDVEKERLMLNVAGQLAGLWLKTPPGGTGEWNVNDGTELDLSWNEKAQHPTCIKLWIPLHPMPAVPFFKRDY